MNEQDTTPYRGASIHRKNHSNGVTLKVTLGGVIVGYQFFNDQDEADRWARSKVDHFIRVQGKVRCSE